MSNSLWPHELQHARLPCPSPTPGAYSNSCPLSGWCHSTSVIPVSSRLQSFPALRSFQVSQLFPSGGQSIGVSASALVLPMNIQGLIQFSVNQSHWLICVFWRILASLDYTKLDHGIWSFNILLNSVFPYCNLNPYGHQQDQTSQS